VISPCPGHAPGSDSGGVEVDVRFADAIPDAQPAIDAAYHAKYDRYEASSATSLVQTATQSRSGSCRPRMKGTSISEVIVVVGARQIGQAIARRISAGKRVLLADLHQENADAAAEVFANAGFDVSTTTVDVSLS
jgi:hypothetical protein